MKYKIGDKIKIKCEEGDSKDKTFVKQNNYITVIIDIYQDYYLFHKSNKLWTDNDIEEIYTKPIINKLIKSRFDILDIRDK